MRGLIILLALTKFVHITDTAATRVAPPVARGSPANITCHFDNDVARTKKPFGIDRYNDSNAHPKVIMRCHWPDKNSSYPECINKNKGYSYELDGASNLTLQISSTTETYLGTYACLVVGSYEPVKGCKLTLLQNIKVNEKPAPKEGGVSLLLIICITGIIAVILAVILTVILVVRYRKRRVSKCAENPQQRGGSRQNGIEEEIPLETIQPDVINAVTEPVDTAPISQPGSIQDEAAEQLLARNDENIIRNSSERNDKSTSKDILEVKQDQDKDQAVLPVNSVQSVTEVDHDIVRNMVPLKATPPAESAKDRDALCETSL